MKLRIARPELKNRVYGRAVEGGGRLWLQYWLWYFYNDYSLALGSGLHEGDWEMVQFRMHDDEPDLAVYAQHTHAEKRPWHEVKTLEGHPLVFVARGSHASYFEAGFHTTEAWYDLADGKRKSPDLELEILEGDGPGWARWTGRWGDTQPRLPGGVHQPSPTGPGAKKQWTDPAAILDTARVPERRDAPEGPEIAITRAGDWMRIDFDFERAAQPPRSLVVTVNSRDEDGVPPRTYTFTLEDTRQRDAQHPHPDRPGEALRRLHEHHRRRPAGAVGVDADVARPGGRRAAEAAAGAEDRAGLLAGAGVGPRASARAFAVSGANVNGGQEGGGCGECRGKDPLTAAAHTLLPPCPPLTYAPLTADAGPATPPRRA